MKTIIIADINDIDNAAKEFLNIFPQPQIIAFTGEMGAGKTTFIKALCKTLGTMDTVNSPTFAIINEYEIESKKPIFHFDLYRLEQPEEVLDIGFEDYLFSGNWCFIEWPQIAEHYLPEQHVKVEIKEIGSGRRQISIDI